MPGPPPSPGAPPPNPPKPPSDTPQNSTETSSPERRNADSLLSGALLAFTGGTLDAFLYLNHGHVFAGAMTGNSVFLGIALLHHEPRVALHHALPIAAFIVGVWVAETLQDRLQTHAISVGLAAEAAGLLVCSFLPARFPDLVFVPLISLLAAYQVASFRKVDQFSYNSTFITGDLRTAIVGLFRAQHPADRALGLRQARELGLIILGFLLGAVAGAVLAPHAGNHTLWIPSALLLVVLAIARFRHPTSPK